MKQQVKAFYFQKDGGIDEEQMDNIFTLAFHLGANKSWIAD